MMQELPFPVTDAQRWLRDSGVSASTIEPMTGDVSPRRYARLQFADGTTAVLAYYPEEQRGSLRRFCRTSALLTGVGVPVPEIRLFDEEEGFMLVADLGGKTLYDLKNRSWSDLLPYYRSAVSHLPALQSLDVDLIKDLNPPLDESLLRRELQQTV